MVAFASSMNEVNLVGIAYLFKILHLQLTIKISKCHMTVLMEIKLMKPVT